MILYFRVQGEHFGDDYDGTENMNELSCHSCLISLSMFNYLTGHVIL